MDSLSAGTNLHLCTASSAAPESMWLPLTTLVAETLPSGAMVALTLTMPLTFMRLASSG